MDQLKQKLSFVSIKVKKQVYLGEEAIAIHIRDVSKKILAKLYFLQNREKLQQAKQTESYTATVSHEMRTPLS